MDPTVVAKSATGMAVAQGSLNLLCTDATLQAYGFAATDENRITIKAVGFAALANMAMISQILFNGATENTALATALIVYMINGTFLLINGDHDKMGTKKNGSYVWLVLNGMVVYGLLNNAEWAITGVKALAALAFVTCGLLLVNPFRGMQLYGRQEALSAETSFFVEHMGVNLVGGSIMMFALASGLEVTKALGYGMIPFEIQMVKALVTQQFDKLKIDTAPMVVWVFMMLGFIGTLAF